MNNRIVVLHQQIDEDASPDEQDVLLQARCIGHVLEKKGWSVNIVAADHSLNFMDLIKKYNPGLVFNLVETFDNSGLKSSLIPLLLNASGFSCTGNSSQAIYVTSDKMLTKNILNIYGLPTEKGYITPVPRLMDKGVYIFKPRSEDASVCISDDSIRNVKNFMQAEEWLESLERNFKIPFMCEKFIWGREFNVSVIGLNGKPRVFKPAEIVFTGNDNPYRIVDYASKWDESSLRYQNSIRTFSFTPEDDGLIQSLTELTEMCWYVFKLSGYARVDFRVDENKNPWILEVNANPCSSPDSGLVAAAGNEGISYEDLIKNILNEATHENQGCHSSF